MTLHHFMVLGLLVWGLPATFVVGAPALLYTALTVLPVLISMRLYQKRPHSVWVMPSSNATAALLALSLFYLVLDAVFGRMKFNQNMFLSTEAFNLVVEGINESVSQGRDLVDLLGALMIFLPFALFDLARKASSRFRLVTVLVGGALVFYETGISRGYLLMAVIVLFAGAKIKPVRIGIAALLSMGGFILASLFRGDFSNLTYSNPLFDGVAFPFINLSLLVEKVSGDAAWTDFGLEFIKKFLPSFIYPKEIFSFNVEMSKVIYPYMSGMLESVSIFTYLGEYFYYGPGWLTALVAGFLLGGLCYLIELFLTAHTFTSIRVFTGLMCIVLLRSRVQDVFSFLLFLVIFVMLYRLILALTPYGRLNPPAPGQI